MATKPQILNILETLRTAYPYTKPPNGWPPVMEMYTTHRTLKDVPIHILSEAVRLWMDAENFFPARPGQLLSECYRIAGLSPGMDFSNIPDPTQGWQTDELTKEYYELEDMFYNGRIFFPPD